MVILDLIGWSNLPVGVSICGLALMWHGMVLLTSKEGQFALGPVARRSADHGLGSDLVLGRADGVGPALGRVRGGLYWSLHASDGLRKLGHGLYFGLFMGLGFVTKYTFPAFLVLPVVFAGWAIDGFRSYAGLFTALAAFMVLAGPWYWGHTQAVLAYVAHSANAAATLSDSPASSWAYRLSAENLLYYPTVLRDALGWPGLLVVGLGFTRGWSVHPDAGPPGESSGGFILTFAGENQSRYILPALPLLAAIVTSVCDPVLGKSLSRFGLVAGLCAALPAAWGSWTAYSSGERAPASRDQNHAAESVDDLGRLAMGRGTVSTRFESGNELAGR